MRNYSRPYLLILPALLYYLIFFAYPVTRAILQSFQTDEGEITSQFYRQIFGDPYFFTALRNVALIAGASVILEFIIALGIALLINTRFKWSNIFFFIFLIPFVLPEVAVAAIWASGFAERGWINSLLVHLGLMNSANPINWLGYGKFLQWIIMLILIDTWRTMPFVMIILLAGLQGMSREYSEAAIVFGAGRWQVIKRITLPLLKPSIQTAIILRSIASIQIFVIVTVLFGYRNLPVPVEEAVYYFKELRLEHAASAYAVIIAFVVAVFSIVYLYLSGAFKGKEVNEA